MNRIKRKILLLEDDKLFAQTLVDFLEASGFEIDSTQDGEEALSKSYENHYDLYLFDINVPKLSGIELLQNLRENHVKTPTIFLTSYKDDKTLNDCFASGCDDYIRKPFRVGELVLRINAVLKRTSRVENRAKLGKECYYDFNARRVYQNKQMVQLPLKVIQLLELFIESNNTTILIEEIVERLWSSNEEHSEGSIRLYVTKVRNIVGKEKIINIRKIGYQIVDIV